MFKTFLFFCLCGALLIGYFALVGEQNPPAREWGLDDGRSSELVATHIDGQDIYFATEDGESQPVSLDKLQVSDQVYALTHCRFRPSSADALEHGPNARAAAHAWSSWQDTFVENPQGGTAVLTRFATQYRNDIVAASDDAAHLEEIAERMVSYKKQFLAKISSKASAEMLAAVADTGEVGAPLLVGTKVFFDARQDEAKMLARVPFQAGKRTVASGPVGQPARVSPSEFLSGAALASANLEKMRAERNRSGGFSGPKPAGKVTFRRTVYNVVAVPVPAQSFRSPGSSRNFGPSMPPRGCRVTRRCCP